MNKKILIGLLIIVLCFIYLFQSSYSKFRKNLEGNSNMSIAQWNIKVNEENITNKSKLTNNITPTFIGNSYVNSGLIAPGIEGYYDIIIDASKVDLDFDYNITSTVSSSSSVKDLITTKYQINPDTAPEYINYDSESGISASALKNTESIKLRIYIKWNDDSSTEKMDNSEDTSVGSNTASTCIMKVQFNFIQKVE